ncbi:hypothetical protein E2C01_098354 [Portunus trituberculatus]|uniref:Uncharacterized protein n=1 Tax=Portunus trituberculatus TaxID=210409 RepID=A0A5B7JXL2_PORTR|nr:hypothetical protein [Portunus trituberculatus]
MKREAPLVKWNLPPQRHKRSTTWVRRVKHWRGPEPLYTLYGALHAGKQVVYVTEQGARVFNTLSYPVKGPKVTKMLLVQTCPPLVVPPCVV